MLLSGRWPRELPDRPASTHLPPHCAGRRVRDVRVAGVLVATSTSTRVDRRTSRTRGSCAKRPRNGPGSRASCASLSSSTRQARALLAQASPWASIRRPTQRRRRPRLEGLRAEDTAAFRVIGRHPDGLAVGIGSSLVRGSHAGSVPPSAELPVSVPGRLAGPFLACGLRAGAEKLCWAWWWWRSRVLSVVVQLGPVPRCVPLGVVLLKPVTSWGLARWGQWCARRWAGRRRRSVALGPRARVNAAARVRCWWTRSRCDWGLWLAQAVDACCGGFGRATPQTCRWQPAVRPPVLLRSAGRALICG
jgi:hypothetical protein